MGNDVRKVYSDYVLLQAVKKSRKFLGSPILYIHDLCNADYVHVGFKNSAVVESYGDDRQYFKVGPIQSSENSILLFFESPYYLETHA